MNENKIRIREIIVLAGAYIAYGVGASFGTGIALMQYHGALGTWGILSQLISCILTENLKCMIWTVCLPITVGHISEKHSDGLLY